MNSGRRRGLYVRALVFQCLLLRSEGLRSWIQRVARASTMIPNVPRATVLPDTNVWRYIVDADAVEVVRKAARDNDVEIVACPAVVYECLRLRDPHLRRQLAKALTRADWRRPMPEAFVECEDLRSQIARHRPEWLLPTPDLRWWNRNLTDWHGGFWRRVRDDPGRMSRIIGLDNGTLEQARDESLTRRSQARDLGHTTSTLRLGTATARYLEGVPGWDGEEFEAWRAYGEGTWWRALFLRESPTMLDWLGPWIKLDVLRRDRAGWVEFWTKQVTREALPREWIRWAMTELQALRKVTSGTPVDNQIATYLCDFDLFLTSDKGFADCVDLMRPHAPSKIAQVSVAAAGHAAVAHIVDMLALVRPADGSPAAGAS